MAKALLSNVYEIGALFKERVNGDIIIIQQEMSFNTGRLVLEYKGFPIIITFCKDAYLLMSTANQGREILEDFKSMVKEIMGAGPICSYDLQSGNLTEEQAMPTIEWNIQNPEERIEKVKAGKAFGTNEKIFNLTIFQENKTEENVRIYGIDPGSIKNVEPYKTMSEVDLYFAIANLGHFIWRMNHDMADNRIEAVDLTEVEFAIEYMIYQTTRFGVQIPEPRAGKHIELNEYYRAWIEFYSNHFEETLTTEEWDAYQEAKRKGEDTSRFMPKGNWQDTLPKDKQMVKEQH